MQLIVSPGYLQEFCSHILKKKGIKMGTYPNLSGMKKLSYIVQPKSRTNSEKTRILVDKI